MWLKKEEEPHWKVIIDALEKMKSYEIAEELRNLHLFDQETKSHSYAVSAYKKMIDETCPFVIEKPVVTSSNQW